MQPTVEETKIAYLRTGSKNVEITGEIIELNNIREVNTRYGASKVVEALLQDETGDIALVVWGELADKISEGDKVKVKKGYVSEWNGKLQLNTGRFGKLL